MNRTIETHKSNALNEALTIYAIDPPNRYQIHGPMRKIGGEQAPAFAADIRFHSGPIDAGFNGISSEAILAVLIDRHKGFQLGPYASAEGANVVTALEMAMTRLNKRTAERMERGVEGTHQK